MKTLLLFLAILIAALTANAQALDPQTLARAGVHDLSDKSNALSFNPAVLGGDRGYTALWELPSFGVGATNNAFSVSFWNKHFAGDHEYTTAETRTILDEIPSSGMRGDFQLAVPVFGFNYQRFGFRVTTQAAGRMNLPKELAVLALHGNQIQHVYSFSSLDGTGQAVVDIGGGFAYRFDQDKIPDLNFGAGFHYYQGVALATSHKVSGEFEVDSTGPSWALRGEGIFHSVSSTSGNGVGFDLGAMATLDDRWEVGLSLEQIGARITWDVKENQFMSGYTDSTGLIIDSMSTKGYVDRAFHKVDTTYHGGTVETQLPIVIQANGRYKLKDNLHLLGDMAIRTSTTVQWTAGLEVGAAAEYLPLHWFALQGGMSVGGMWGARFGAGIGLRFSGYVMDLGGAWNGGMFNGARGVSGALSQRILF
jgi:hypothetical protein